jgi:thiol:disulfide interchange protein DsbD
MALTLAIVSFSCTGPILGTLLAGTLNADSAGAISFLGMNFQLVAVKLTVGMTGFGLALGLPFAIFAAFPAWLNSLPKSGGWLNSVKVILGFVEVALAVKFLSNADLVEQWGLLRRETFFALWFLCAAGLTLYIFGIIKFPHDSPVKKISASRIFFGAASLAFAVYLFPGIIGAKWWNFNLLSGFPPPSYYSYFQQEHEMKIYTDFETGMRQAKEQNKPVMIDFTGWACVNCRKMEENVWSDDRVKDILNEKYVVISLYVDERTVLSPEEQHSVDVPDGEGGMKKKKIKTIGDKWSTLEALTFANNTQPLYVLLSPDSLLLGNPVGYTPDIEEYMEYLNCGIETYKRIQEK